MAEVAANIESKVSLQEYRQELSLRMQEKVSFEDMKRYVTLHGATTQGGSANDAGSNASGQNTGGPMMNRQFELVDEEMRRLREKVEDTYHQVQSMRQIGGGPASARDHTSF